MDLDVLLRSWHPENWDELTLAWLRSPGGAKELALLQALPRIVDLMKNALDHQCEDEVVLIEMRAIYDELNAVS
jgi:hypothetical protein